MRTTLNIDDDLLRQAKRKAAEEGKTLTRIVEEALRERIRLSKRSQPFRLELLTVRGRLIPGTNLADRDSLYEKMEGRG